MFLKFIFINVTPVCHEHVACLQYMDYILTVAVYSMNNKIIGIITQTLTSIHV